MEVINKSLNLKGGDKPVRLKLLDTAFALDGQYGTIGPSSKIDAGSTRTTLLLKNSYSSSEFDIEREKWRNFKGLKMLIRSEDYSVQEEVVIKDFPGGNQNAITIEELSFDPLEDYICDPPFYPDNDNRNDQFLWKQAHVFRNPQVEIVSGINSTMFTVSVADADRFRVDQFVRVHNEDFTVDSAPTVDQDDLEIVDVTGQTITVSKSMGFTPSAGFLVDLIGFKDKGKPYRFL